MELVPAVGRHLKAWSTWIAVSGAVFDALWIALESVKSEIDPHTFALINAGLLAAIKIATLLKQNIPVTDDQRDAMITSAIEAPVKEWK